MGEAAFVGYETPAGINTIPHDVSSKQAQRPITVNDLESSSPRWRILRM